MTDIVERLVVDDTSGMRQYEREARTVLHSLLSEAAEVIQTLRKELEESKASDAALRAEALELEAALRFYAHLPPSWTIQAGPNLIMGNLFLLGERARAALAESSKIQEVKR